MRNAKTINKEENLQMFDQSQRFSSKPQKAKTLQK